jgi:hypothetical protein
MSTRHTLLLSHLSFHLSVLLVCFIIQFFYRFTFGFLLLHFFVETVPAIRGGWNNTRWPQNLGLKWLHASSLSSCGLSFYCSLFFFFLLSLSFNSSFLLLSSGNRTAKLVPIPFCSRDLPERYLLLFLSPTFFLCSCVSNL